MMKGKTQTVVRHLTAHARTVHLGESQSRRPVLRVDAGATVRIDTVAAAPKGEERAGRAPLPEMASIDEAVGRTIGTPILTGPVAIAGAQPGDALQVQILEVGLRHDWGSVPLGAARAAPVRIDRLVKKGTFATNERLPLEPFFSVLRVAAPGHSGGVYSGINQAALGGAFACPLLTAGAAIYLPVWREGAHFSVGGGRACGHATGVDTALSGTFRFELRRAAGLHHPVAVTRDKLLTFGFGATLEEAQRQAKEAMLNWAADAARETRDKAETWCAAACDYHIADAAGAVKKVYATLPRSLVDSSA